MNRNFLAQSPTNIVKNICILVKTGNTSNKSTATVYLYYSVARTVEFKMILVVTE